MATEQRQLEHAKAADELSKFLWELSDTLDGWAEESRKGRRGAQQLETYLTAASECRRFGAKAWHLATKLGAARTPGQGEAR